MVNFDRFSSFFFYFLTENDIKIIKRFNKTQINNKKHEKMSYFRRF